MLLAVECSGDHAPGTVPPVTVAWQVLVARLLKGHRMVNVNGIFVFGGFIHCVGLAQRFAFRLSR